MVNVNTSDKEIELTPEQVEARRVKGIIRQIEAIEATVTPRRYREAALTTEGKVWLQSKEDEIAALRAQI